MMIGNTQSWRGLTVDMTPCGVDRIDEGACYQCRAGAQKLLGVLITIGEAVAYVVSGMYGDVRELGTGNAILIIVQVQPFSQLFLCLTRILNTLTIGMLCAHASRFTFPHAWVWIEFVEYSHCAGGKHAASLFRNTSYHCVRFK